MAEEDAQAKLGTFTEYRSESNWSEDMQAALAVDATDQNNLHVSSGSSTEGDYVNGAGQRVHRSLGSDVGKSDAVVKGGSEKTPESMSSSGFASGYSGAYDAQGNPVSVEQYRTWTGALFDAQGNNINSGGLSVEIRGAGEQPGLLGTINQGMSNLVDNAQDYYAEQGADALRRGDTLGFLANGVGYTLSAFAPRSVQEVAIGAVAGPVIGKGLQVAMPAIVRAAPILGRDVGSLFGRSGVANSEAALIDKSWKVKIEGVAQPTGNDAAHQIRTYREAIELAKDPEVVSVHLDHGYNRALDLDPKTISPNRRPDVTAIYSDGRVARVEVQSATDNPAILRSRNAALDSQIRAQGYIPLPPRVVVPTRSPVLP